MTPIFSEKSCGKLPNISASELTCPPLVKWPGGKRFLVSRLSLIMPRIEANYYEPFAGGAALFFHLVTSFAVLSDTNVDLINLYQQVRDQPLSLISTLKAFKNDEESYYKIRAYRPRTEVTRAARFLYLTRLAFNGIYRVNRNGSFNVPYGKKTHIAPCDESQIMAASRRLQHTTLKVADFQTATAYCEPKDTIYFDPPIRWHTRRTDSSNTMRKCSLGMIKFDLRGMREH